MSIQTEINRISQNVADSLTAVANKGVTVPQGSNSDDLPDLIAQIQQGSSGGIVISDTADPAGGTVRTITAVEISGTKQITTNGVQDVTEYAAVNVAVPTSGGTYQAKTNISPSTSSQTITPDAGFDALSSVQINAMPSGTAGTPTATKGTVSNHQVSVTPSVTNTTGYITGGTKNGTAVTVSASELVSGSQTITENGTVDVTNLASVTVNVSGGGSSKNIQAYRGYATVTATSYTATAVTLTVAKTGTYNISWMGYRNTNSGTSGSQLYVNGTARGTASTTFVNTYGQSVSLTNQSLNQGDVLVVRARARSTSYVMGVGNLIIEEV